MQNKEFFNVTKFGTICYISMVIGMHRIRRLFLQMVAAKEEITMKTNYPPTLLIVYYPKANKLGFLKAIPISR